MAYKLITSKFGTPEVVGIHCLDCGLTSLSREDINNRYCGFCKKFHESLGPRHLRLIGRYYRPERKNVLGHTPPDRK